MKRNLLLFLLVTVVLSVSACSGQQNTDTTVAVSVALTQTAASPSTVPQAGAPTQSEDPVPATATLQAAQPLAADAVRIEFQPNSTSWYTNGDLSPNTTRNFVLSAFREQQMTISLTTEPASNDTIMYASLTLSGANGEVFIHSPQISWSGTLPASQDY